MRHSRYFTSFKAWRLWMQAFFMIGLISPAHAQLDLLLHEVDPSSAINHVAEDFEGNVIVCRNHQIGKLDGETSTWIWTTEIALPEGSQGSRSIMDMTVDASGNIYLAGRYSYSVVFGTFTLTSAGNTVDMFVTKLDNNGNFLWAKSYGTNAGTDEARGITLDGSGNIYITGSHFNKNCSGAHVVGRYISDIYVAKLNSSGNAIWQKRFPPTKIQCGNGGGAYDIGVDGSGNIYTTGAFSGTFKFGSTSGQTVTSIGYSDVFTVKLNNNGTAQWARAGNGVGHETGNCIYVDAAGNVAVGGFYGALADATVSFAPYTLQDVDGNLTDGIGYPSNAFLVKYLSNGNIAWALNPGSLETLHNEVKNIIAASGDNIYISLPSLGIKTMSFTDGSEVDFVEMVDNFFPLYTIQAEKMRVISMASSASGYVFTLRGRCGAMTMENLSLANTYCTDCATSCVNSYADALIIRPGTGQLQAFNPATKADAHLANAHVAGLNQENALRLFPNPASDELTIQFAPMTSKATLTIYDCFGRQIWSKEVQVGEQKVVLQLKDRFGEGTYHVAVVQGENVMTETVIVSE